MSDTSDFLIENGILKKYLGLGGNVVLPQGVIAISQEAFQSCKNIISVVMSNEVTKIGKSGFAFCSNLKKIVLSQSLQKIESYTFQYCSKLEEIVLPDNLTEIETGAFYGCKKLKKIVIPAKTENFGENIFYNCNEELMIHYDGKQYKKLPKNVRDYMLMLWLKENNEFSKQQTEYIKKEAFRIRKNLMVLLKWGGSDFEAWRKCNIRQEGSILSKFPQSIKLEWDSEEMLGRLLSCGNWKLEDFEESIQCVNDGNHPMMTAILLEYKNRLFPCTDILQKEETDLLFDLYNEKSVKQNWTYRKDKKAGGYKITGYIGTELYPILPEYIGEIPVVAIANEAFRNSSFIGIYLPNTLISIGNLTFADCEKLEEIILPDSLEALPSLFLGCTNLKKVVLPKNLHWIGNATFPVHYNCYEKYEPANYKLEEILIHKENPWFITIDGVLIDKEKWQIIHVPAQKEKFVIPEEITKIATGIFAYTNVKEIYFHTHIKTIGNSAFYGCDNLKEVILPEGELKELGECAFCQCKNLEYVRIPNNIKKIGEKAFEECPKIILSVLEGSYAEKYAKEHAIPFVIETF